MRSARLLLALGLGIVSFAPPAHATDLVGVRSGVSAVAGQHTLAQVVSVGYTRQWFIDGFGARGSLDFGYLHYSRGGREGQLLVDLELAIYFGRDDAKFRPYLVAAPLFTASPQVYEGMRVGAEVEWRDMCNPRSYTTAIGVFYQPMRDANGLAWDMFGPRFTLTWEHPTIACVDVSGPAPPLPGPGNPPSNEH